MTLIVYSIWYIFSMSAHIRSYIHVQYNMREVHPTLNSCTMNGSVCNVHIEPQPQRELERLDSDAD